MKKIARRMLYLSLGLVVLLLPFCAKAYEPKCYTQLTYGVGVVRYLETSRAEDRFFSEASEYIVGHYDTHPKSGPYSFGFGCELYKFWGTVWGVEVAHHEGLRADVVSRVALQANISGYEITSDTYEIRRRAELSGYGLKLTAKTQLYGPIYATAKLGAIYAKASVSLSSPSIPYNIEVGARIEGPVPIAGAGLLYQMNQSLAFGPECEFYGKYVRTCSLGVRLRF